MIDLDALAPILDDAFERTGGRYGISVTKDPDGGFSAAPDPTVPPRALWTSWGLRIQG